MVYKRAVMSFLKIRNVKKKTQECFGSYYQLESGLNVNRAKFLKVKPTLNIPYP